MSDITSTPPAEQAFNTEGPPVKKSAAHSGVVTAVAVVNFALGAVEILNGVLLLVGASAIRSVSKVVGAPAEFAEGEKWLAGMVVAMGIVALLMALLMGVAGWGVLQRRPWSRLLTLVLAGVAVLAFLGSLSFIDVLGLIVNLGYAVFVFVVLLNPRYAAEFSPGGAPVDLTPARFRLEWPAVLLALGALVVGILIGWLLLGPRGTSSGGPKSKLLVVVMQGNNHDPAMISAVAAELTKSNRLRVVDPSLVTLNNTTAGSALQMQAKQFGADLMVVVEPAAPNQWPPQPVHAKVIETQTGVLLASGNVAGNAAGGEPVLSFVESAAAKFKR